MEKKMQVLGNCIGSVVTQKSHLHKSRDIMLKYIFIKSESRPRE